MSCRAAPGSIGLLACLFVQTSYAQKIYWHHWENGTGKIKRANLDGTNPEDIIDLGTEGVGDIAIDRPGGKIYWTAQSTIRRANLDGSVLETFLPAQQPGALAIDEVNRRIYWGSDLKFGSAGINRATLDGQLVEEIVSTGDSWVYGLAIDSLGGKIYYSFIFPAVFWANLDGSQAEILIPNAAKDWTPAVTLDLLHDKVYWTDFNGSTLRRANLDGTSIETLPIPVSNPYEIAVDPCNQMLYWNELGGAAFRARFDGQKTQNIIPSGGVGSLAIQIPYNKANGSPKCIPTLSPVGMAFLGAGLAIGAVLIMGRRRIPPKIIVIVMFFVGSGSMRAQNELWGEEAIQTAVVNIDSGSVSAEGSGQDPDVIFSHSLQITGAPWLRLHFSQLVLSGSRLAGNASFVRMTGTQVGATQTMDAVGFQQWANSSAYFKGDSVLIELLSYPNTGPNQITVNHVTFADTAVAGPVVGICGDSDDRVPSVDPRVARLRYKKPGVTCSVTKFCTAFLVEGRPNVLFTAGHCCDQWPYLCEAPTVEFNVPLSAANGSDVPALPIDQFAVENVNVNYLAIPEPGGGGLFYEDGEDWCVFGVWPNSETGTYPVQRCHSTFRVSDNLPIPDAKGLRVTGHGLDYDPPGSSGQFNQYSLTQQRATGPHTATLGNIVEFRVDAHFVNSGSPVQHVCGDVFAILTDGGCEEVDGANQGTAVDHPLLVDALTPNIYDAGTKEPKGVAADCNQNGIKDWCDVDCREPGSPCQVPGCGTKADCNENDVPDECESTRDCNNNSIRDICEVYSNPSIDCNKNGVPDSCDLVNRCVGDMDHDELCTLDSQCDSGRCRSNSMDCNANSIPDECDICAETVTDCNLNFVPDACDISSGTSCDGDYDGIPDECQPPYYGKGACCLSSAPGDCISLTRCQCEAQGMWFFGVGVKCQLVNCQTAPQGFQAGEEEEGQ